MTRRQARHVSSTDSDTTTACEVVLHLGMIVRELLLHDLPTTLLVDGSDRRLIRQNALGLDDYLHIAFGRLRLTGTHSMQVVESLVLVMGMTVAQLDERGLTSRAEPLRDQAELVVNAARQRRVLPNDVDRVLTQARRWNLLDA